MHPHESPALMTVPLVILAVASTVVGVIDLPFGNLDFLENFHDPLFGEIGREVSLSGAAEVGLIILATVLAFLGILFAYQAWVRHKIEADRLEPEVLQRGWYINDALRRVLRWAGPSREPSSRATSSTTRSSTAR